MVRCVLQPQCPCLYHEDEEPLSQTCGGDRWHFHGTILDTLVALNRGLRGPQKTTPEAFPLRVPGGSPLGEGWSPGRRRRPLKSPLPTESQRGRVLLPPTQARLPLNRHRATSGFSETPRRCSLEVTPKPHVPSGRALATAPPTCPSDPHRAAPRSPHLATLPWTHQTKAQRACPLPVSPTQQTALRERGARRFSAAIHARMNTGGKWGQHPS